VPAIFAIHGRREGKGKFSKPPIFLYPTEEWNMSVIRILPEEVAAQIAAGEVIERPASIVKELMDNSIDSGPDRIFVKIDRGGKELIRVTDNGCGMAKDDLLVCLERHATSKISDLNDLFSIRTLGFRGEALSSICAVSELEVTSRVSDDLIGHRLKASGGRLKSIDEVGAPAGTTVEVRHLFFNTPVRKKFLRSERTETDQIIDMFSRIALPFANIHFRLDAAEDTILNLPASENETNRFTALFGRNLAASMIKTEEGSDKFKIRAYLSPPEQSRMKGDRILLYVNQRNIRDRLLTHAIMEGYGQRLMRGHYPQAVIVIEIDPLLIDINVHPTKQEVRFHQPRVVHQALVAMLEKALKPSFPLTAGSEFASGCDRNQTMPLLSSVSTAEPVQEYLGISSGESVFRKEGLFAGEIRILGQLQDTYLLCQAEDGLIIVDQHAAHERIVYETLKKSFRDLKTERQTFLIPPKLELSIKEARIIDKRHHELLMLGLEIEPFGGETFILRSVPSILVKANWVSFFHDMIPLLEEEADFTREKAMDRVLTVMACHGAIRAGQVLSQEEIALLLRQLEEVDLPTNCPHGRPVFKKFSFYEIEKMFKRVL
jgi:DNA mismatch repair protein MutL